MFEVALALSMPVYVVKQMPYSELNDWARFFNERPIGWREDRRTAVTVSPHVKDFKPDEVFESLKILKENKLKERNKGKKDQSVLNPQEIAGNSFIQYLRKKSGGKFLNFLDKEENKDGNKHQDEIKGQPSGKRSTE